MRGAPRGCSERRSRPCAPAGNRAIRWALSIIVRGAGGDCACARTSAAGGVALPLCWLRAGATPSLRQTGTTGRATLGLMDTFCEETASRARTARGRQPRRRQSARPAFQRRFQQNRNRRNRRKTQLRSVSHKSVSRQQSADVGRWLGAAEMQDSFDIVESKNCRILPALCVILPSSRRRRPTSAEVSTLAPPPASRSRRGAARAKRWVPPRR